MKKILIFLLAAIMMFSTFACTKNNGKTPAESTPVGTTTEKEVYVSSSVDDPNEPDGLLIANEGKSKYVIVRGENASVSEVTAATELQSYIKKITNVELPVVTDATAETKHEIIVGKTNREEAGEFDREELGDDGFVIRVTDKKLWLVGGEKRGTLYSVYGFLEEYLGCRYYTDKVEKIPEMSTILLDQNMPEDKQIPVFIYRETYSYDDAPINAKFRLNGSINTADERYGGRIAGSRNHNLYNLIDPAVYYDEHPEYFSQAGYAQPCLTNREVIQIVIENTRKYLNENPDVKFMSLCQEDNRFFCTCAECTRVLAEEQGVLSGVLLRFVNEIATTLKDEFPDVLFTTFAYNETKACPIVTQPADNVTIVYADIYACMSHPLSENEERECKPHPEQPIPNDSSLMPAWSNGCESMLVWDYTTNFGNYNYYVANFRTMLKNVKFFADNKAIGVFEQSAVYDTADFWELRKYIVAKILWDPYMSDEEYNAHINDFLEGFYGPGWEALREYIDYTEAMFEDTCFCLYEHQEKDHLYFQRKAGDVNPAGTYPSELTADMIRNYTEVDWTKYMNWYSDVASREYLDKGAECFARALAEAETDEQRFMIEKASLQIDYIESFYLKYQQGIIKSGAGKVVSAFFDANPGLFTADEQTSLKNAINTLAKAQLEEAYLQYNLTLRENLLKYGIFCVREISGDITNLDSLNMTVVPCQWGGAYCY